jgi:lysophospholipase L1-like esterase
MITRKNMGWIRREIHNKNNDREKTYSFAQWMSWLFLLASVLLLIYTYYRSEITYKGTMDYKYFKYYVISFAGILFWGFVLRLQEGFRTNIVTITISLVLGLYLVEGGLTLIGSGQPTRAAAELGVEYDKRSKLKVIEDLTAKGIDAVPTFHPIGIINGVNESVFADLLPLAGVSNKTTVYNNESGKYLIYESDRYGFNNPDSEWNSSEVDWLLTGDSFTHGAGVQPGQEIAGQLRSISDSSVISLGIGGNGPLIEYAELIEYGKALKPAKVLWVFFEGNDLIGDLQSEKSSPLLMQYMEDGFSQNLINRQQEIDSRLRRYIIQAQAQAQAQEQAQGLLYKTQWIRLQAIRAVIGFDFSDVSAVIDVDPLFADILTKAKAEVDGWEGKLYFVYLPEYARYKQSVSHDDFRRKSEVIELVKGLGIPVVDIHQEVFANHTDPLALFPFRLFGHYNADGYSEVAKAIVKGVNKYQ